MSNAYLYNRILYVGSS